MKILILPLSHLSARQASTISANSKSAIFYYCHLTPTSPYWRSFEGPTPNSKISTVNLLEQESSKKQKTLTARMRTRMASTMTKIQAEWAHWGVAPATNWKFKVHSFGEKLLDKIDSEESFLKGIPKSVSEVMIMISQ